MLDSIKGFLAENYVIFIAISAVLLLALIGFIVTGKKKKKGEVQTADPVAQPNTVDSQMPGTPMGSEMPSAITEPVTSTPDMNTVVSESPVTPATQPVDASLVQTTVAEPQVAPMEPAAPVNSDEPTLVIEDKTVSQEAPVMPAESSDLFATPNTSNETQVVNTPVEPVMPAEPVASVTPTEPVMPAEPVAPAESETPVTPVTPASEGQQTSIFENQ